MPVNTGSLHLGPGSHVVQFYRTDGELADGVGSYLAHALAGGSIAVVAATPAHTRVFASRLAAAGLDVGAAQRSGSLLVLDAAAAVARFAAAGVVDRRAFDAAVAQPVRRAAAAGRPVRVYGEMVALLWDRGHVNAALELETLWNELGRELQFSLYCAYPERSVSGDRHRGAHAAVRRLHAGVISLPASAAAPGQAGGQPETSRAFTPDKGAPRAARRFVTAALEGWGRASLADDAALVVTELATNAVVHAESRFTVTLAASYEAARISVADDSPLARALIAAPGHGLSAVDAVAAAWGVQPAPGGKTVWAQLRRP